jgi:cytochrome c-type biogenesis protein CcmH/NrfG
MRQTAHSGGASIEIVGSRHACLGLALALAASTQARAQGAGQAHESAAAREQARLCERLNLAAGAEACREALALGIGPARRAAVRQQLARQLVALEDWDALTAHLREDVSLEPQSALGWQRLGLTLLFALHETQEALGALQEAVRLAPADAEARLGLAQALAVAARPVEAKAAFETALRLDPLVLEGRPAARAAFEAARGGAGWP